MTEFDKAFWEGVDEVCNENLPSIGGRAPTIACPPQDSTEFLINFLYMCKFGLDKELVALLDAGNEEGRLPFGLSSKTIVQFVDERETGLVLAAKYGQQATCAILINRGSDIHHKAINEGSVLLWCTRSYDNKNFAVREPYLAATINFLVSKGADVNAVNNYGESPLHWAMGRGSKTLALLLLQLGAKTDVRTTHSGWLTHDEDTGYRLDADLLPADWARCCASVSLGDWLETWVADRERDAATTAFSLDNPSEPDVMISLNCRTMSDTAIQLKKYLQSKGFSTWICMDMDGGQAFRSEIVVAATASKVFLPLINEAWALSKECQYEYNIAQRNELTVESPVVLPVIVEEFDFKKHPSVFGMMANTNALFMTDVSAQESVFENVITSIRVAGVVPGGPVTTYELPELKVKQFPPSSSAPVGRVTPSVFDYAGTVYVMFATKGNLPESPATIINMSSVDSLASLKSRIKEDFPSLQAVNFDVQFKDVQGAPFILDVALKTDEHVNHFFQRVRAGDLKPILQVVLI